MHDADILPRHPWDEQRERMRELAVDDRPGDPTKIPFDPRVGRWDSLIVNVLTGVVCAGWVALIWWAANGLPTLGV